jgi:transposase
LPSLRNLSSERKSACKCLQPCKASRSTADATNQCNPRRRQEGDQSWLGRKERDQLELFITGSLRQLIPDEHVLARVDRVLDLSWLRNEVADCYCLDDGRPGIDPETGVRLMLAGLLMGIVHDRKLMREAEVNIAIRWFIGYGLHEKLPHHSSLTRIRQRWGEERFRRIFKRTVEACLKAKIATAEVVHIDASLIGANVSWGSLVERHVAPP